MNKLLLPTLAAATMLASAAPAFAAPMAAAIANVEAAVARSAAVRNAETARQTTYKTQIDQYNARAAAVQAQIKPLQDKLQRDAAAPAANTPAGQQALMQQQASIQQIGENAQRELNGIIRPVIYSQAYVEEQVQEKLDAAVKAVLGRKNLNTLLKPDTVYLVTDQTLDVTNDIVAELDRAIPNAQIVPPQGWEPRQIRESRAQQQGQAAPAPATPKPSGR